MMLSYLNNVWGRLPKLLELDWNSLNIDYHPPLVERLWIDDPDGRNCRIYLHRIHPCDRGASLRHVHPWPSAIRIVEGMQEVVSGVVTDPPAGKDRYGVGARFVLEPGSAYEMTKQAQWHSVRSIDSPALSLMVSGAVWPPDPSIDSQPQPYGLKPLPSDVAAEIKTRFEGIMLESA